MRIGRACAALLLAGACALGCFGCGPVIAGCDRAAFRIVLDVGHSPEAPGARSAHGIDEYRYNLRLASVIEASLAARGFTGAGRMLTGGGRETLGLRAARANAAGASLLLSIHHDSVQSAYLERWAVAGEEQFYSDRFTGWSLFVSQANARAGASVAFARLLADRLLATGLPFTRHHAEAIRGENRRFLDPRRGIYRRDDLAVLAAATVPAVLLEAGVIVNRDEEALLSGPERQARIAGAVVGAAEAFCERPPGAE